MTLADKFRQAADSLQRKINDCYADRPSNTPKRARQAAQKRNEGQELERGQAMLRALADLHDSGTVPPVLANLTTRAAVLRLAREEADYGGGYYDAPRLLGYPYKWGDKEDQAQAAALWALVDGGRSAARALAEELRRKIEALRFAKIPGYFPTPAGLVAQMIAAANLRAGARVLEPSAGSGAIADALRQRGHNVDCIERHASLAEILRLKGHQVMQADFTECSAASVQLYDAVLMNPPFENGQDCEHVQAAWSYVKPGGALVAIMGAGVLQRENGKHKTAREWLEAQGAEFVTVPAGTFRESGTGVASVMVALTKPATAISAPAPIYTRGQLALAL